MGASVLQFVIAAAVIVAAGTALTRFADAIADLTKLGRLLVGSIFLAGATSLPELLVDVNAVRLNLPDVAVGDLMGSLRAVICDMS
jgi:cation:H+ antiporter